MSKGIEDLIDKKIKKAGKKEKTIDLFNTNDEANANNKEKNNNNEDEDDDFVMNAHVIDAKDAAANKKNTQVDLENQRWEESEAVIVHQEEKKQKVKGASWGDSVKHNKTEAVVVDEYFPSLGDDAKPRPKPKNRNGLTKGGDAEEDSKPKFTSSKGGNNLAKFMQPDDYVAPQKIQPTYDPTLNDEHIPEATEAKKFSGKVKVGYEISEAEKQRLKYMQEMENRAKEMESKTNTNDQNASDHVEARKFVNSKGAKNNGLFMTSEQQEKKAHVEENKQEETEPKEEKKRLFTNSKGTKNKNNGLMMQQNGTPSKQKDCEDLNNLKTEKIKSKVANNEITVIAKGNVKLSTWD